MIYRPIVVDRHVVGEPVRGRVKAAVRDQRRVAVLCAVIVDPCEERLLLAVEGGVGVRRAGVEADQRRQRERNEQRQKQCRLEDRLEPEGEG